MNIYVESNFVLELALLQEHHHSCESIFSLCESGKARIVVPSYSLVEPYETLKRRHKQRETMKIALDTELRQLGRTSSYEAQLKDFEDLTALLADSAEEENRRLEDVRSRLLNVAEIIPLDRTILEEAARYRSAYDFEAQDSIVYASVLSHLTRSGASRNCFLNKDRRDFGDPDIAGELKKHNCKLLLQFTSGYQFLRSALSKP